MNRTKNFLFYLIITVLLIIGAGTYQKCKAQSLDSMRLKGRHDATEFYRPTGALVSGAVSGLFFPVGVVPYLIMDFTPPKEKNWNAPDATLLKDPAYHKGYKEIAYRKKQQQTTVGYLLISLPVMLIGLAAL